MAALEVGLAVLTLTKITQPTAGRRWELRPLLLVSAFAFLPVSSFLRALFAVSRMNSLVLPFWAPELID